MTLVLKRWYLYPAAPTPPIPWNDPPIPLTASMLAVKELVQLSARENILEVVHLFPNALRAFLEFEHNGFIAKKIGVVCKGEHDGLQSAVYEQLAKGA